MIRALLFFLLGLCAVLAFAYVVRKPQRVRMSEKHRVHFVDAYEEAVEPQSARCSHPNSWFSRDVCGCGWMHTHCTECAAPLDGPCATAQPWGDL